MAFLKKHSIVDLDLQKTPIQRTLGVLWDMENDLLKVKAIQKEILMTKRGLLNLVSSIFDPLGIITPAIIEPKHIIQLSWQRKIDWDDPLPLDLEIRWKNWLINLRKINHVSLPHWLGFSFVDTSCIQLPFGTVAFFHIKSKMQ